MLACASLSCTGKHSSFWKPGLNYHVTLSGSGVLDKNKLGTDSEITAVVHLDSVARDSLYGSYQATRGDIGRLLVQSTSEPGEFVGRVRGDSVDLEFEPRVRDGSLRLSGTLQAALVNGRWVRGSHLRESGRFRIERQ